MISTIAPLAVLLSVARAQDPQELFEECTADEVAGVDLGGREFGYAPIGGSITTMELTSDELGDEFIFYDTAVSTDGVCTGEDGSETNCIYVVYQSFGADQGPFFIGYIDELSVSDQIAGETQLDAEVESIAFDCDGTMYGTVVGSSETVTINLATGATTTFSSGGAQCAAGSGCFNTLVYNSEEQQLYRFSSSAGPPESLWVCAVSATGEQCSMVNDPDNLCMGDGRIAISATDIGDEGVGLVCSNGAGSDVYVAVDLDDFTVSESDVPGLTGGDNAFSTAYYNTESGAYCACDFDGEGEINGDDDDDDSSSISSESVSSVSSDSSDSSSISDAKAFFAQVDTAVENDDGDDALTQESAEQVSYTYELSLSDSSLQVAWIMFAMCMLVNLSVAFCVWRKKRTEVIV